MSTITIEDLAAMIQRTFATKDELKAGLANIRTHVDDKHEEIVTILRLLPTREELFNQADIMRRLVDLENQVRGIKSKV